MGNQDNSINYVEFPLLKNAETKRFYGQVFIKQVPDPNGNELAVWSE